MGRRFRTHDRVATNWGVPKTRSHVHVENVPIGELRLARRNVHQHSKKQIQQIANSIAQFGFINPVITDSQRNVLAGFGRVEASKVLDLPTVPVISVSHLSEAELRAYMLADNKLTENAGWDRQELYAELTELQVVLPEVGLDLGITAFGPAEIDALAVDFEAGSPNTADEIPPIDQKSIVAQIGDVFQLHQHRLMVADARDTRAYPQLMGGEFAEMAFLDPPYNVRIRGHVGGRGRTKHREFLCASGEMNNKEYIDFLKQTLGLCAQNTVDGAIHYVCCDWRHSLELQTAGADVYEELKNICVWVKSNAGQGAFYRSRHEFVFVFKNGRGAHLNTFEMGQHGRSRTNVWNYPGTNSFRAGRLDDVKMHPTVKPTALVVDAMRDCSRRGSVVLDTFAGSGTSIMAAEQIGRRAFCLELDPAYVDVAILRWQRFTGRDAILDQTRQTFDELAEGRRKPKSRSKAKKGER